MDKCRSNPRCDFQLSYLSEDLADTIQTEIFGEIWRYCCLKTHETQSDGFLDVYVIHSSLAVKRALASDWSMDKILPSHWLSRNLWHHGTGQDL